MAKPESAISTRSRKAILARLQQTSQKLPTAEVGPDAGPAPRMHKDPQTQFAERVRASSATLVEIGSLAEAPGVIREEMRRLTIPGPVVTGEDPVFDSMAAESGPGHPQFVRRSFGGGDRVALSHAVAGIAETGSLALISGPGNPVTLNYLPDLHIILLSSNKLVVTLDALWPRLRQRFDQADWPRSINLVTGPSRTADVEQTIQLGAHGPRKVLVIEYHEPVI